MKRLTPRNPETKDRVQFLMLLPNLVTLTGMSLGLTSMRYAMDERFTLAVFLLLLAAIIDGLDGLIARRLNATSKFGAELDSLSDFLCFGVAPALLVYTFHLEPLGSFGWIAVLVFATSTCMRLARFNVMRGWEEDGTAVNTHFLGVPAPAGAMLALMPVFATLAGLKTADTMPFIVALWMMFVAILMISKIPTISPKSLRIPRSFVGPLMVATVMIIGMLFTRPWFLLVALGTLYLCAVIAGALSLLRKKPSDPS